MMDLTATAPRAAEVTVVIPTKDRPTFLRRAVRSALSQSGVDVEIIVVDDVSARPPDVGGWGGGARVCVLRNTSPLGASGARNAALLAARGRWIAFLDDDDMWGPGKLAIQIDRLERARADFSWTGIVVVDAANNYIRTDPAASERGVRSALLERNVVGTPSSVIMRRELTAAIGLFDEALAGLEDWDYWIRAAQLGRGVRCPEILVANTAHTGSGAIARSKRAYVDLARLDAKRADARAEAGVSIDRDFFDAWVAAAHAAAGSRAQAGLGYLDLALRRRDVRYLGPAARQLLVPRFVRTRVRTSRRRRTAAKVPGWVAAVGEGG
jgi:glycosyltransferase involved in cell wall biosynthesis